MVTSDTKENKPNESSSIYPDSSSNLELTNFYKGTDISDAEINSNENNYFNKNSEIAFSSSSNLIKTEDSLDIEKFSTTNLDNENNESSENITYTTDNFETNSNSFIISEKLVSESFTELKEPSSYIKYNSTENLPDKELIATSSNIISESTINEASNIEDESHKELSNFSTNENIQTNKLSNTLFEFSKAIEQNTKEFYNTDNYKTEYHSFNKETNSISSNKEDNFDFSTEINSGINSITTSKYAGGNFSSEVINHSESNLNEGIKDDTDNANKIPYSSSVINGNNFDENNYSSEINSYSNIKSSSESIISSVNDKKQETDIPDLIKKSSIISDSISNKEKSFASSEIISGSSYHKDKNKNKNKIEFNTESTTYS